MKAARAKTSWWDTGGDEDKDTKDFDVNGEGWRDAGGGEAENEDIAVVVTEKEEMLGEIRREKEEMLEENQSMELKRYREYELKMINRLVELNGDVDDLEKVVIEREGLVLRYEQERKSIRKFLGFVVKVGSKRTLQFRKRLIKQLLR